MSLELCEAMQTKHAVICNKRKNTRSFCNITCIIVCGSRSMMSQNEADTRQMPDNTTPELMVEWTEEDENSLQCVFDFATIDARTDFMQARVEGDRLSYSTKSQCTTDGEMHATVTTPDLMAENEMEKPLTLGVQPTSVSALETLSDVASQQQRLQAHPCTSTAQPRVSLLAKFSAPADAKAIESASSSKKPVVSVWERYESADTTPLSTPAAKQALAEWKLDCAYKRWVFEGEAKKNDPTRGTQLYDSLESKRIALYNAVHDRFLTR